MLKEIVTAIESYFRAHQFIKRHKLWKWILIPGLLYMILFIVGMILFIDSSNTAVNYLSRVIGVERWLQKQSNALLSFLFVMGQIMIRLLLLFFYFSLFKYLFLIIGSPVFAYLSEKTEAILEGRDFPFSFKQLLKDILRGIRLALRNALWQTVYVVSLLILSFVPVVGWIVPVISVFIECYYYGFSMLDYSCERHKMSPSASIEFIGKHKGLAIGNGLVFYVMHAVPFLGWVLAPAYAVIAATLSLYYQNKEV
ncbi:EI24 domain-containing protein [Pinibacter aurantiacus]|uniref:EI24 domain-containing protein n=1 Tax=Pinibacter aurantiacus TaxID=2851599 RepID=A0A9E2S5H1_9BACT|nr:EI24 domain-containing protein [Pinibacter aurantiacus]MBV4356316.1 EI24 domain-containing protein [Pinibacter aurantiacus]